MAYLNKLISSCRTTEADAVSDRLLTAFNKNDWSSDTYLTGVFSELQTASDILTSAINKIKYESTLEAKDEIRDEKVKSLHYVLMGFIHHPDENISNAAKNVNAVFEHYGINMIRESYAIESSLIESLLEDLSNPELQSSIDLLPGISEIIAGLRTAQTEFEDTKVLYEEEKAREGAQVSASQVKKDVVNIINNKIVVYLRAMAQADEAKYGFLTQTAAEIIEDINILVRKRRKGNEPEEVDQN